MSDTPADASDINVQGRRVSGLLQGFGQLWQKTYWVRLSGSSVSPKELIREWKRNFTQFWPEGNRFYAPITGIAPGEVAFISIATPGNVPLSTGVMVVYSDDESFSFMMPEGHMFAGMITFSAFEKDGATVAQAQALIRASDPTWEIGMRLFGFKKEDAFWHQTLESLAAHVGVQGHPQMTATVVDPRLQWSQATNIRHNALMRSVLYGVAAPLRWIGRPLRRRE